jgi:polyisoprenoid-binding protein YceI
MSAADLTPGTWTIDPTHSSLSFSVRHLMISKVRGSFTTFSGAANIAEDRSASTVELTIDPASVATGDENRDGHLRTGDFFDVANHPTWTFRSNGLQVSGDEEFVLRGDLTIRGVTKPVEIKGEFAGVTNDLFGNTKAGFSAEAEINRKDWGLEYNAPLETGGVVIGDKVKLEFDIQLIKS